jgi:uncharacterized damage-inducible protein DinB
MVAVIDPREGQAGSPLAPLADEEYVCHTCGVAYAQVSIEHAVEVIGAVPAEVRAAVSATPPDDRRRRPVAGAWSVAEYVCHLRDVYATYTIRLHRTRTEDEPLLEPMLNDLRARRFRYNEHDVDAVLVELAATAAGFCEEVARTGTDQWGRTAARLPGERRTARWLVRQAMHEGRHHLLDIRRTAEAVAEP